MPAPVAVVPEDRFAPAAPSGLTALAGTDSVELVWEPNREPDFRTYRVYRSVDDSEWKSVADGLTAPAFSDRDVMPGKRYRYTVTGVDERGNESARAEPFEIRLP
jgi:fibronectin type 3 domain-containing protein